MPETRVFLNHRSSRFPWRQDVSHGVLYLLTVACSGAGDPEQEPVATVAVSPAASTLVVGQTGQLSATLRDAAGTALTGRSVTWAAAPMSVATVSASGLVTAVAEGTATITATSEGQSGTAQVTVGTPPSVTNYALRFYANVLNDQGRVKIRLDDPATSLPGPPADIGATDITIEFWLRGTLAQNGAGPRTCGANNVWIEGNIVLDRDRFTTGGRRYGLSLAAGRVVFGLSGATDSDNQTICSTSSVLDDQWHHIAVTRRVATGALALFIDGVREAQVTGPPGDISYPDAAIPSNNCAGSCAFSDPFLVLATEKHDIVSPAAGFNGFLDELRLSTTVRYTADFARPTRRFTPDAQTAALYHFDEGQGTTLGDTSGAPGGPSPGTLQLGGAPAGPAWILSSAPTGTE